MTVTLLPKKPLAKRLESGAVVACSRSGAPLWYIPDDLGMALGPDLISNGGFDSASDWTAGTGWTISAGTAAHAAASGAGSVSHSSLTLALGKYYAVAWTNKSLIPVTMNVRLGTATVPSSNLVGRNIVVGQCLGGTAFSFQGGGEYLIDDVQIWEVLSASVFQDSVGSMPAYLGSPVGLLMDQQYGKNNRSQDLWSAGNVGAAAGYPQTIQVGDHAVSFTDNQAVAYRVFINIGGAIGKTYQITFDNVSGWDSSCRLYLKELAGATGTTYAGIIGGITSFVFTTNQTTNSVVFIKPSGSFSVNNIRIREIYGYPAVQSTTADKPNLSRVPRKWGGNLVTNGTFDTNGSGWTTSTATLSVSSGEATVTATSQFGSITQQVTTTPGKYYHVTATARLGTSSSAHIKARTNAGSQLNAQTITSTTPQAISFTFVAQEGTTVIEPQNLSAGLGTFIVDNIQVREVLEWSYALAFDGTTDALATTLTTGASGTLIAAMNPSTLKWQTPIGSGGQLTSLSGAAIKMSSSGPLGLGLSSPTLTTNSVAGHGYMANESLVFEATYSVGSTTQSKNGVNLTTAYSATSNPNASSTYELGHHAPGITDYLQGNLVLATASQSAMSEADRRMVSKFGAFLIGVPYAN